jgi:hypothetical protein
MIQIVAQALIIEAATKLGGIGGAWVSLSDVRRLVGMSRADFDQACHTLAVNGTATLVPEDNQKTISANDEADAVMLGEPCHLITIH